MIYLASLWMKGTEEEKAKPTEGTGLAWGEGDFRKVMTVLLPDCLSLEPPPSSLEEDKQ